MDNHSKTTDAALAEIEKRILPQRARNAEGDGFSVWLDHAQWNAILSTLRRQSTVEPVNWQDRYYVEQQGFWWWVVKCGTGTRTLFKAHTKSGCEEIAQELTTAFNDGLYAAPPSAQFEAGELAKVWTRYVELFGDSPHGTEKQMAALLALLPAKAAGSEGGGA